MLASHSNSTSKGKVMKIETLKFTPNSTDKHPSQSVLEIENQNDLAKMKEHEGIAALLMRSKNLESLRGFKDLVEDRGLKNKAKQLSKLMLGNDKIPLTDGNFSGVSQVGRSINQLLSNAFEQQDNNLYIIGIEEESFNKLWELAGKEKEKKDPAGSKISEYHHSQEEMSDISSWILQELKEQCSVPLELSNKFIGVSEEVILVRHLIIMAGKHDNSVLILGDTGTGKEVVSRQIHEHSRRSNNKEFIAVNCGGIPKELFESELFGHKKGSFTGATSDKIGLWETAGEGTLFLDEIGDLRFDHQVKILRALDEGVIRRVGGTRDRKVKARVIAATNRDLFSMVQAGKFREDLYYRLRGFLIRTPALRDRQMDIPVLAQFFWKNITRDNNRNLPQDILDELKNYSWPGNARELKMVLNNLCALFGTKGLRGEHLRAVFLLEGQISGAMERPPSDKEIPLHRAECLRHLKRVHEIVHASSFALYPIMKERSIKRKTSESIKISLKLSLHEIEVLCQKRLLFHGLKTLDEVLNLKEKISDLQYLLQKDFAEARDFWNSKVAEAFKQTLSSIFKEIESVLKEG